MNSKRSGGFEDTFERVQEQIRKRAKYSPMHLYNGRSALRARNMSLLDTSDEKVEEYLSQKAEMPPCPRCSKQITVSRWGYHHSPTAGKLQQYCCRECNYEFMLFPEPPPREDVEPCPDCHSVYHVRKEGTAKKKSTGERYQKYYCGECNRWFK